VGGPATSQGGVWIRIASSVEPTNLASALSLLPVWPGVPCVCWPTRRCCQVGPPPGGAIGPNFGGTLGRRRTVLGSATPSERPVRPGARALGHLATHRLRRCCTAAPGGRRTGPQAARPLTTFGGVHAGDGRLPGTAAAAWAGGRRGTYGPDESGRSPVVGWADSCHTVAWFTAGRRWRCKVPGDCS
jgi:hypothetical protein